METLTGTISRVKFVSENSAWTVAELRLDDAPRTIGSGRGDIPIVGELIGVTEGERVRLVGRWTTNAKFGRQFEFKQFTPLAPATVAGIRRYLASGLVDGIGPELAKRLVGKFGAKTLDIIEQEPHRLQDVEGIGPKRAESIRGAYDKGRSVRDIMVFLHSHGVSTHFAVKILEHYGDEAVRVVRNDPYRLAIDISGIGFFSADRIAQELGIAKDSPTRVEAGLLHCLGEGVSDGHVYLPAPGLLAVADELLGVDRLLQEKTLIDMAARASIVAEPLEDGSDAIFLPRLHRAETSAAGTLAGFVADRASAPAAEVRERVDEVEEEMGIELAPAQREALESVGLSRALVVTGGPGTGKTTIVRGVVRLLRGMGLTVALAAPTGRAARRMQEATQYPAKTIHRLLEFAPTKGGFQRDGDNPVPEQAVVVDEASMLDISLFNALLNALSPGARLVLVGDVDQLPSVGPGSVLADLIDSGRIPVVRLQEVFRQSQQSGIVRNAYRILRGENLEPNPTGGGGDFFFIEKEDPPAVLDVLLRTVERRIPSRFGLDPAADVQVLAPMYRGLLGTDNLNESLQALLNPDGVPIRLQGRGRGRAFRVGDKVMQIRNNYDKDVFNGDLGRIVDWNSKDDALTVTFDGRFVSYSKGEAHELVLAYAVSVHKSQGSEYPAVVVPLHTQHWVMLQRNLFYTAVTRGRKLVVVIGNRRALRQAIGNDRMKRRFTRLEQRLRAI